MELKDKKVKKPKKVKDYKIRVYETKWKDLKRRGFSPPRNAEENRQRLREAHGFR